MNFFKKKENQAMITVVMAAVIIISAAAVCFTPFSSLSVGKINHNGNYDPNGIFAAMENLDNAEVIKSNKVSVVLDKKMPQAICYKYENGGYLLGSGNTDSNYYIINGEEYAPEVTYKKVNNSTAEYTVTIKDAKLSDEVTSTIEFVMEYKVDNNEVIRKITSLKGDSDTVELWIQESNPVLQVDSQMPNAGFAASTTAYNKDEGNMMYELVGNLSDISTGKISNGCFSFVWNDGVAAGVYTPSADYAIYQSEVTETSIGKQGVIYAGKYYHRFEDGVRAQRESVDGKISDLFYEMRIGFTDDCNKTGAVDWQDAALWLRGVIPQMSEELRDFLSVGSWGQYGNAYPPLTTEKLDVYTKVYGTYAQLLETQRQFYNLTDGIGKASFEIAGWQGRGHDYGWPDLSEQPFNPALGDETTPVKYKELFEKYGGDLSFHINTSDASGYTSRLLLRDANDSNPLGNSSVVNMSSTSFTGDNAFGWDGYHVIHFLDFVKGYAKNRQEAFVKKYYAPFIMYSDVMSDHTTSKYNSANDEYGKARIMQHWKALGINMATEIYAQEKYLNGQFLFNTSYDNGPNRIDSFMLAGNSQFVATRKFQTEAEDYVWGYLGGGVGSGTWSNSSNGMAQERLEGSFKGAFLSMGTLGKAGIISFTEDDSRIVINWNEGYVSEYDKTSKVLTVTQNGEIISRGGNMIFAVPDDDKRALVYCTVGSTGEWKLPDTMSKAKNVNLYKLTTEGREFIDTLKVKQGKITFEMDGKTSYVLEKGKKTGSVDTNLALSATISASSKFERGYTGNGISLTSKVFSIPASKSPTGNWKDTIYGIENNMFNSNGGIKYEFPVSAYCASDGDSDTYWEPNADADYGEIDLEDGEAFLEYKFGKSVKVSRVKISEVSDDSSKVTSFEIQYMKDGQWNTAYSGDKIPEGELKFETVDASRIRIVLLSAKSLTPRISEVAIYE